MAAKRKSKKNQIVEVDFLELIPAEVEERLDYTGVKLLLRRVEPELARGWQMRERKLYLDEKRRAIQDPDHAAVHGEDSMSNEFYEEYIALGREILEATVVGMRHIEGIGEEDQAGALDEIAYIGNPGEVRERARAVQTLSARERFRAAGDGSGGNPAGAPGTE